VIWISVPKNILQRAFSAVTPFCPSIVEPVHAFTNVCPAADLVLTVVVKSDWLIAERPVSPVKEAHRAS
jgi:hypothetical protein